MGNPAVPGHGDPRPGTPGRGRLDWTSVAILVLGAGYFAFLFFPWNALCLARGNATVCVSEFGTASGWHGIGIVAGLVVAVAVVWEGTAVAGGLRLASQETQPAIAAGLAAGVFLFTLLRVLTYLSGVTVFAWLGLALSAALAVAAAPRWLRLRSGPPWPLAAGARQAPLRRAG